jgi:multiple sugar transport system substrate-binding protein
MMSVEKRMVSRKKFLKLGGAGLALSAGLPLIAGCGEGGGGGGAGAGITATYMKSGTYDVAAKKFAEEFASKNDTSVDIEAFPYAALRQNNTNAVISGSCDYNVVSGSYYLANIYNNFRPLDDLANRSNYAEPLAPGLWDHSEFYKGQHIGVPYGPDAYGLMYRTDLWEEAGLSWPGTWDEFSAALETLESQFGGQGITPFVVYGGATEQLPALLFATYDSYFLNDKGKFELDSAKAIDSIKFAEQLLGFAPEDVTALSIDEANTLFTDGNAAVLYGWPSFVLTAADDPESSQIVGKWQVGADPQPGFVWLSLWQMYMDKCTEDADTAWKWMSFWTEPENDMALFTKYGVNPVLQSTYQDQELLKEYSHYLPGEQKNVGRAMNPPLSGEAQDFLASTLGEVFAGKTSAEEAVRSVNQEWAGLDVPDPLREAAQRYDLVG